MILDVSLASALFLIAITSVFLYAFYEKKIGILFGGQELRIRHVILLIVAMGITVSLLVFIPLVAMRVLFLFAYSATLFLFAYLFAPKWYLAFPAPVLFIGVYFSPFWNIYLFNFFGIMFAICISVYMGNFFTWKTTLGYAFLLTIVDVVQVLITRFMQISVEKALELELPVGIILPTFPFEGWSFLGLGDIFLFGLLNIQNARKYGRNFGLASISLMAAVFLLLQTFFLNINIRSLPATVLIVSGWLIALGARHLYKKLSSTSYPHQI